ncbi:MAG: cyclic 2,3-diphosphoglycerate synthase [Porticoccaceae bacterium]|nr:cyclic 2,3-diphosphoglycerate synthase [Porticoccaceae bacterium]
MAEIRKRARIVIMGAAGRDFHNFNTVYRDDPKTEVVAFTAAQIPNIDERIYPVSLSGELYPKGIAIIPEAELADFCRTQDIAQVVFAYSDLTHQQVMHRASIALAAGADFLMVGPHASMLKSTVPVIAISAVRTGCGKSQTCRWIASYLKNQGLKVAVLRHPMPYGHLSKQAVQRFESMDDLDRADCTIEEREEYEPHLSEGILVYAGVDYARIVAQAEKEVDLILWDGGNNDFPFIEPDLHIALVDPLRPGHETSYHPGETVLRMADIVLVPKVNVAAEIDVQQVIHAAKAVNPQALIIKGESTVYLDDENAVRNQRALVIEDGPTTTHGGMAYGAGYIAAVRAGAKEIVDPREGAVAEIRAVFEQYPHLQNILPAVGYFPEQLEALRQSINAIDADVVVSATPCDLEHLITVNKPIVRVGYEYTDGPAPNLESALDDFLSQAKLPAIAR